MGDVLIPSLRCGNLSVTICVRVSRFWDFSDPQDDARLLHCDMVLLDEEGNSIHATIYPPFIEKFRPLIKEGSVYNMTYFRVRASNNLYKPVPNDIMITFTNWKKLEQVIEIPPAFPTLTYSLTHIDQIHSRIDHKDYYTDAIGIVTSVSNVSPHRSKGQQASSLKRNISICSASRGASVNVVLWGAQATLFPGERIYENGQNSPQIVLFVGTLVKKYADGLCLTGSSPCKWYINPSIPEAETLMSSARGDHKPVKWNATVTSSQLISPVAEEQKVSYIKYLHPFENKGKEFLVTVTIRKIDNKWWYNSCRKCACTAVTHGDSYKCTNRDCANIAMPVQRYKILVIAGDETADTDFILFGRVAQRIVKRPCDMLIANTPSGFIPDAITKLLERTFVWNVSFSGHTINSGNVCFQVNATIKELGNQNVDISTSTAGTQQSSFMFSQGASSSMKDTPHKTDTLSSPLTPLTPQGSIATTNLFSTLMHETVDAGDAERVTTQTSTTRKRSCSSPGKSVAKKLFVADDEEESISQSSGGGVGGPRS
ncbi:hypothetical protein ACJX0J_029468, partial [Zea mays]